MTQHTTSDQRYRFEVTANEVGQRLDRFLAAQESLPCTRSYIKKLIAEGQVQLRGKAAKSADKVRLGDHILVIVPPPTALEAQPQAIPLDILYEDEHLLVVNKAVGMVVHPAPGHPDGTLVNALLHHCQDLSGIGGALRPGIVHRIDRDTSGSLVVAKHDQAHQGLKDLFQQRPKDKLDRRYLALSIGPFREDHERIETKFGRHPTERKQFSSRFGGPRHAITEYWVKERLPWLTLLELRLETGRTHQIRVHLSDRQRPLLGDQLYPAKLPKSAPKRLREFPRQALHAWKLSFEHPVTGAHISCEAPLPTDLSDLLTWLRQLPPKN